MERLYIDDYEELSDIMHDEAMKCKTVYAVLFYDEAIELIRALMDYQDVELNSMEIAPGEFNGYFKEYVITLDSDMRLDVEPIWHEANQFTPAGYLWIGSADILYIDGDASSSILKNVDANTYELVLPDDEAYDEDEIEEGIDLDDLLASLSEHATFIPVLLIPHIDFE